MTKPRPGTLTITYGDEVLTLDASDPWPKFTEVANRMDSLLAKVFIEKARAPAANSAYGERTEPGND